MFNFDYLFQILQREYIRYAFIVGICMALCGALLGVSLVLRKHSMIGDGLSHVGFGAVAVAACLGWAPLPFAIPVVIFFAKNNFSTATISGSHSLKTSFKESYSSKRREGNGASTVVVTTP